MEKKGQYDFETPNDDGNNIIPQMDGKRPQHVQKVGGIILRQKKLLLPAATIDTPSSTTKVAFSVRLPKDIQLGHHQPIEYDQVITNIGNAFDTRHGHFIAPVNGVYFLSYTITNVKGHSVFIEMVKNGSQIAIAYADGDDYSMGSQTIVVQLVKGDVVWVRHTKGGTPFILGGVRYNSFSGSLLFEM